MGEPILRVRELKKHFPVMKGILRRQVGTVKAVDGISFDLEAEETISLVGESGCGKTTCGRSILRLIEPNGGSIQFRGSDLTTLEPEALRAMRRHMQIIFQDPFSSLNPRQTVGQIIGDPMILHGLATKNDAEDHAKDLLDRVGLQPSYASRYPHEFSGGQRQRIGIARAVALKPDFIVCDEAVSALDVSVQAQVINLLLDLKEEFGLSYLFIAHDLSVVRHISDKVAVMYLGRVVEFASRDQIFERAYHPYTQALLSAVPHANPRRKKERIILPGDVPSPINPPGGCHFHTRCPLAERRCGEEAPAEHELEGGHKVSCHLYDGNSELVQITSGKRV
jgi:oligopeptide/dipeptide ABC transporter ATP-binding protein